jgi:excisionase family DNA binding protein
MPKQYTTYDVGGMLGVAPYTIARWIDSGALHAERTLGGHRRVTAEALREFLIRTGRALPLELGEARFKVLFIDDEESALRAFRFAARPHETEMQVLLARDVADGLFQIAEYAPDALVVDVHMPGLDGIEFCRGLRRRQQTSRTRFLMVSAFWIPGQQRDAREAGAEVCFDKPLDPIAVLELLRGPVTTPRT